MRALRKPPALRRGDTIGVVTPSSPIQRDSLASGLREVEAIGYRVLWSEGVFARRGFFAGDHRQRVEALLKYLEDPSVRAIFCARGGYGSNYVVEHLAARAYSRRLKWLPPKIVMGYSDVTTLLLFLNQTLGWATFQGPMLNKDFADGEGGYDRHVMERILCKSDPGFVMETDARALRKGAAEGRLLGGCLPMMTATLGTPHEIDTRGTLLLIEDIDEKPFRIDRMLFHLRRAGKFRGIKGVIFGQMPGCGQVGAPEEDLRAIIEEAFAGLDVPMVFGMRFGHTTGKSLTLPLGVRARLSAGEKVTLTLLESAVAPARKAPVQKKRGRER